GTGPAMLEVQGDVAAQRGLHGGPRRLRKQRRALPKRRDRVRFLDGCCPPCAMASSCHGEREGEQESDDRQDRCRDRRDLMLLDRHPATESVPELERPEDRKDEQDGQERERSGVQPSHDDDLSLDFELPGRGCRSLPRQPEIQALPDSLVSRADAAPHPTGPWPSRIPREYRATRFAGPRRRT